jgi:hypothetical protein
MMGDIQKPGSRTPAHPKSDIRNPLSAIIPLRASYSK